jgi:hypothetical protein
MRPLERREPRWEGNIKKNLIEQQNVNLSGSGKGPLRAFVNTVTNF